MYINGSTDWGRVTHIYESVDQIIIGSDNGLAPTQCQNIMWASYGTYSPLSLFHVILDIIFKHSIGSGNDLLPSGNKPLPASTLNQISVPLMAWIRKSPYLYNLCCFFPDCIFICTLLLLMHHCTYHRRCVDFVLNYFIDVLSLVGPVMYVRMITQANCCFAS